MKNLEQLKQEETDTERMKNPESPENETSTNTVSNASVDNKDESFVILFDDQMNEGSSSVSSTGKSVDDESFLIMFDDNQCRLDTELVESDDGCHAIRLGSDISVSKINTLYEILINSLEACSVSIDTSDVQKADTSSIQLLESFRATLAHNNVDIKWSEPSQRLKLLYANLGVPIHE